MAICERLKLRWHPFKIHFIPHRSGTRTSLSRNWCNRPDHSLISLRCVTVEEQNHFIILNIRGTHNGRETNTNSYNALYAQLRRKFGRAVPQIAHLTREWSTLSFNRLDKQYLRIGRRLSGNGVIPRSMWRGLAGFPASPRRLFVALRARWESNVSAVHLPRLLNERSWHDVVMRRWISLSRLGRAGSEVRALRSAHCGLFGLYGRRPRNIRLPWRYLIRRRYTSGGPLLRRDAMQVLLLLRTELPLLHETLLSKLREALSEQLQPLVLQFGWAEKFGRETIALVSPTLAISA